MNGKLYFQNEEGKYEELGSTKELKLEPTEIKDDAFTKTIRVGWNTDNNFIVKPTYKEWHKKKKGKRYIWYYKIKQGINPKIIKELLKGGKK